MNKSEILALISKNPMGCLGTVDGKAPRVRFMDTFLSAVRACPAESHTHLWDLLPIFVFFLVSFNNKFFLRIKRMSRYFRNKPLFNHFLHSNSCCAI